MAYQKQHFKVKMMDCLNTNTQLFTLQDSNWWTGDMWISCGLSFWRHPFTAEDPLASKWCNANFSKSILMKKQTHLHLEWPEGKYILANSHVWVNYSLKILGSLHEFCPLLFSYSPSLICTACNHPFTSTGTVGHSMVWGSRVSLALSLSVSKPPTPLWLSTPGSEETVEM